MLLSLVSLQPTSCKEFRSQGRIIGIVAAPDGGARHWCCFPHASHLHAKMMSFKKNCYTMWVQHRFQSICDLLTNPLLYSKALRKEPHQAGKLGDTDDVFVSDVTYVSLAVKWKGMVFTERKKWDGSL